MTPERILRELSEYQGLPRAALRQATRYRAEVLPLLLEAIDGFVAGDPVTRGHDNPVFFAFHLLGQWRATEAYRPLARLLRCPSAALEDVLGDALTETSDRVMAAVFDGDPQPLYEIILDERADEYIRAQMFDALVILVVDGRLDRDEVAVFLRDAYRDIRPQSCHFVWAGWSLAVGRLGRAELTDFVETAYRREFIDPTWSGPENFHQQLRLAIDNPRDPWSGRPRTPFGDTIEELSRWHGFSGRHRSTPRHAGQTPWDLSEVSVPVRNPWRDTGRNDPCPCGSGRKFKRCCMGKVGSPLGGSF